MFSYLKNKISVTTDDDVFLCNKIEKYLISVLRPLNLMQSLFICAKYSIHNSCITLNSCLYNLLGLFLAFGYRFLILYYYISTITFYWEKLIISLCLSDIYQCVSCSIGFILNYYSNIIHDNDNVLLVLKVQEVQRALKINGKHLNNLLIVNWLYVIVIHFTFSIDKLYVGHKDFSIFVVMDFVSNYACISFEVNIVYATFFMSLLGKMINVWIGEMQLSITEEINQRHWTEMFDVYFKIIEAYNLLNKCFRLLVSF